MREHYIRIEGSTILRVDPQLRRSKSRPPSNECFVHRSAFALPPRSLGGRLGVERLLQEAMDMEELVGYQHNI